MPVSLKSLFLENADDVERYLARNFQANIYVLGDLETSDERAVFRIAYEGPDIVGVQLTFELPDYPIIWLSGNPESAERFVSMLNLERFVMITESSALGALERKYQGIRKYPEDVMHLASDSFRPVRHENVRKIRQEEYFDWATSLNNGVTPDARYIRKAKGDLKDYECFGYYHQGKIVSRGVVHVKSRYGWALGGIYTLPEFRGKGFATSVMSGIVDYSRSFTGNFILFVRSDNEPALNSYSRIGFRKVGERTFVDLNTGQVP